MVAEVSFEPVEILLTDPESARTVLSKVWAAIKESLTAGARLILIVKPEPRTNPQNKKLHAMFGEIANQWEFMGRRWHAEDVKRLMVDAFHRATRDDPELAELWKSIGTPVTVPSIDGRGVVSLGLPTRQFPVPLASAFIEWMRAWGVDANIAFTDDRT
jgi:NinB protein